MGKARKISRSDYTQEQRDALPTVYGACSVCKGWVMVIVDDPNDTAQEKKNTAAFIGRSAMRGDEIKRTTVKEWRESNIPMCECERGSKKKDAEPKQQSLLEATPCPE